MDRSADGETIKAHASDRRRRRLAHGLLVLAAVVASVAMVGVAGSAGLTDQRDGDIAGSSAPLTAGERQTLQALAAEAVVRVVGEGCGGGTVGTGFAVDGALVTNHHLVHRTEVVTVDRPFSARRTAMAAVVRASPGLDLAELEVAPTASWGLGELPQGSANMGERVLFAGFGGGRQLQFVEASVHLVVPGAAYGVDGQVVLIDHLSGPGYSGGPVINRNGEVIAVLKGVDSVTGLTVAISTAMLAEPSWLSGAVPEAALCN